MGLRASRTVNNKYCKFTSQQKENKKQNCITVYISGENVQRFLNRTSKKNERQFNTSRESYEKGYAKTRIQINVSYNKDNILLFVHQN